MRALTSYGVSRRRALLSVTSSQGKKKSSRLPLRALGCCSVFAAFCFMCVAEWAGTEVVVGTSFEDGMGDGAGRVSDAIREIVIPDERKQVSSPEKQLQIAEHNEEVDLSGQGYASKVDEGLVASEIMTEARVPHEMSGRSSSSEDDVRVTETPARVEQAAQSKDLKMDLGSDDPNAIENGRVSWERSFPAFEDLDIHGLFPLARHLLFTNRTLLNYFHLHKTGGVSTKAEISYLFDRDENQIDVGDGREPDANLSKADRRKFHYEDTCYAEADMAAAARADQTLEKSAWRCDFERIRNMDDFHRNRIDVVLGHQYWDKSCEDTYGKSRDVRYFSIFRHPLDRKMSFFYHFFVRAAGRDEQSVTREEIVAFLLAEKDFPGQTTMRDAGPNYYASRLLSDGMSGFEGRRYVVPRSDEDMVIDRILNRLESKFAFVGLQSQNDASQCMIRKTMQTFMHARGQDRMVGTERLSTNKARLNKGAYPWTSRQIWDFMSLEQRHKYRQVERVDLAVYSAVVQRFRRDVNIFACAHLLSEDNWESDAYDS